jgi:AAA+ ATPase superfamily predicted ATPase
MTTFIGRQQELKKLEDTTQFKRASLVVIRGRRRVGKSRLITEFAKNKIFLPFTGLAPIKAVRASDQLKTFAYQCAKNFDCGLPSFHDWNDAFSHLSQHLQGRPTVILFDEISWMGSKDRTFLPKLKAWWDLILQNYPQVILVLCGSVSTWISKNIINSTAFFGRITLNIDLPELSLSEAYQFLKNIGFSGSLYDICKILSVVGGIPWYLEQILPHQTADENIKRLCFEKDGMLVDEFDKIFHDLFKKKSLIYKKIIAVLTDGMRDLAEIRQTLNYAPGGALSHYIKDLMISGFVSEHFSWAIKTNALNKQKLYRLSDNYLRFYVKYIEPNLPKIKNNAYQELSLSNLPGWEAMMGFQVETLLLKNRPLLLKALNINPAEIVADNPYHQKPTIRQKGCQIDYLIQTHANNLFVCEFKFKKRELSLEIVESMKEKINRFAIPKGFGICPVLVHLGGVANSVYEKRYFYRIIDIADLLEDHKA